MASEKRAIEREGSTGENNLDAMNFSEKALESLKRRGALWFAPPPGGHRAVEGE